MSALLYRRRRKAVRKLYMWVLIERYVKMKYVVVVKGENFHTCPAAAGELGRVEVMW